MKRTHRAGMTIAALVAIVLGSCRTDGEAARLASPGPSSISTESLGFSPMAEAGRDSIEFALSLGRPESVLAWKVELQTGGSAVKTVTGQGDPIPSVLSWDGKTDSGKHAPEGSYVAKLFVYYDAGRLGTIAESSSFVLDLSPPTGAIGVSPAQPTLGAKGFLVPTTITIDARSNVAAIESWALEILDPKGRIVRTYSGRWPDNKVSWDGTSYGGAPAIPLSSYRAVAMLRDEYGNMGEISAAFRVGPGPAVATIPKPTAAPPSAEASSIAAFGRGLSPNGDGAMDDIELYLDFGQPSSVKAWKVDMMLAGKSVREITGPSSPLPRSLLWDGKAGDGRIAPEGLYQAKLTIDYGTAYKPVAVASGSIILAVKPPTGSVALSHALFSPLESSPTIDVSIAAASGLARMESWSMRILDPAGNLFRAFEGEWPDAKAVWDGMGILGYGVESAENYAVTVKVRDEFGNAAILRSVIPVDILVEKIPTGYHILSSRIYFRAYTADYSTVAAAFAEQNAQRLDQLAEKLRKFPEYSIRIVGHAVMIYWDDEAKGAIEQRDVLIPLSSARAEAVAEAMVARGFDPAMLRTEGVGGADQLVPDSDLIDRWRNRRVAFFLEKP